MNREIKPDDISVKKGLRDRLKSPFGRKDGKEVQTDIHEHAGTGNAQENNNGELRPDSMAGRLKHLANRRSRAGILPDADAGTDSVVTAEGGLPVEAELPVSRFSEAIARYRPAIERVVLDGLVGVAEEKLQDEVFLSSLFNRACDVVLSPLPGAVRLVLPRERLLKWLLQNREPLIQKLGAYRISKVTDESDSLLPDTQFQHQGDSAPDSSERNSNDYLKE